MILSTQTCLRRATRCAAVALAGSELSVSGSEVVAPDEVLPTALAIADDIAANVSTKAARVMKDLIYRGAESPEEAHLLDSRVFHGMALSEDAKEGKESFLQKRKPEFKATMADAPSSYPWWTPVDVRVKPKI